MWRAKLEEEDELEEEEVTEKEKCQAQEKPTMTMRREEVAQSRNNLLPQRLQQK
jgi:hypothetical protein